MTAAGAAPSPRRRRRSSPLSAGAAPSPWRRRRPSPLSAGAALAVVAFATAAAPARASEWVAAWGASPAGSADGGPARSTVRNLVRVSVGGTRVRIRVANALSGTTPLVVGAASLALAKAPGSAALVAGSARPITFDGRPGITLAPKTPYAYSDPVDLPVSAQQDLAVTLTLPADKEPGALAATWNTSFVAPGDALGDESGTPFAPGASSAGGGAHPGGQQLPLNCSGCATYALTAVDVLTDEASGAVVGLGSSTFHGYNSDQDAWNTVLNDLSVRIGAELPSGHRKAIVNAGIGADTLHAGMERVERDVFSQSGVTGVIPYDLNDIAPQAGRTAEQVIADYRKLIALSHPRGIRVLCPTWPPESTDLSPEAQQERDKINAWILTGGACDDVVDWDRVVRDPRAPLTYKPEYTTGSDTIHPNATGHRAMADAVPMRWFADAASPAPAPSLGLPSARRCASRRRFVIHLRAPRDQRIRSARVFVNGREVATAHGRARVDLRGLPATLARVTIFLRTRSGRSYVRTRAYRTCG